MPIDMSAAKAPPRKRAPKASLTTTSRTSESLDRRVEGLLGLAQLGQGALIIAQQFADAAAIGKFFPPLATEIAKIAETSDGVAKRIDWLISVGPYAGVIAAASPLILQILANHKVIDATHLIGQGILPPDILAAQMKADIDHIRAEAIRAQKEALDNAAEAEQALKDAMNDSRQGQYV